MFGNALGSHRIPGVSGNKDLVLQCAVEGTFKSLDSTVRPQLGYMAREESGQAD